MRGVALAFSTLKRVGRNTMAYRYYSNPLRNRRHRGISWLGFPPYCK